MHRGYKNQMLTNQLYSTCLISREADQLDRSRPPKYLTHVTSFYHVFPVGQEFYFVAFVSLLAPRADCHSVCFPSAKQLLKLITDGQTDGLHLLLFYSLSVGC